MNRTQHIAYFKVPYKQKDNDNYQNNDNFCCGNKKSSKGDGVTDNEDPELNQFYYHSDHLGSSSYITNLKGSIVQHVEYVPFGEVFIEERNNKWNTPYLFNGKELDEETGLYYYGARYYNSRNSLWLSVDPLAEKYPNWSPYRYGLNNPIKYVDPDGRIETVKPTSEEAFQMIKNTLSKEDAKYVKLDSHGNIDEKYINNHKSKSVNYNSLKEMVNSKQTVEVLLDDKFDFVDSKGNKGTNKMSYLPQDSQFPNDIDINGNTMSGTTTGEAGFMGKTLFPDRDGKQNSPNANIKVIINKHLSNSARAEIYSHEGNGHALLYIRNGGNHNDASHQPKGLKETNLILKNMIIKSKKETIKNMR